MNQYQYSRRTLSVLAGIGALALIFAACSTGGGDGTAIPDTPATNKVVQGIALDVTTKTLIAGETLALKATLIPENASNKKVTWTSSDGAVARVAGTGLDPVVTALKTGTTTITATTADGNKAAACAVSVKEVTSFTISGNYKQYYNPNEAFDASGILLTVIYSDGTSSPTPIPVTPAMYTLPPGWNALSSPSNPANAASERRAIPITYGKVTRNLEVTLRATRYVTIIGTPVKTRYKAGENFDFTGLMLVASYDTGGNTPGIPITSDIASTSPTSPYNLSAGTPTFGPFTYQGMQTTAVANLGTLNGYATITGITVRDIQSVTIVGTPAKTTYRVGDPFDFTGVTLTASYGDAGNVTGIPITPDIANTWSGYSTWSSSTGPKTLGPFTYKGRTTGTITGITVVLP